MNEVDVRPESRDAVLRTAQPMGLDDAPDSPTTIREIKIEQLNYGYIVKVGCSSFAIETAERLIEKLSEYIKEPQATESKWRKLKSI